MLTYLKGLVFRAICLVSWSSYTICQTSAIGPVIDRLHVKNSYLSCLLAAKPIVAYWLCLYWIMQYRNTALYKTCLAYCVRRPAIVNLYKKTGAQLI